MCNDGGSSQSAMAERLYGVQADISKEQFDLWKSNFLPLEKKTIADVGNLSSPEYVDQQVGLAKEDVGSAFTMARNQNTRQLQGLGLNPADGMYGASERQLGLAEAGTKASIANNTRLGLKDRALSAQMGLVNTGRGIASGASAGLSSAAGGLAQIGQNQANAAAQNNAGTGQAVGTAAALAMAYF